MIADAEKSDMARKIVLCRQTGVDFTGPLGLVACATVFFWLGRRNCQCVGRPALQLRNLGPTSNFVNRRLMLRSGELRVRRTGGRVRRLELSSRRRVGRCSRVFGLT